MTVEPWDHQDLRPYNQNIRRKYGKIPDTDGDLLHTVWEVGIEEEELARVLVAKNQIAGPQKEKKKEATPKGKQEQKDAQGKEMEKAPAVSTSGLESNINNIFTEQVIL